MARAWLGRGRRGVAGALLLVGCELPPGGAAAPACGAGTHAESAGGCHVDREADALVEIAHAYRMSDWFELVSIGYSLDGRPFDWKPHSRREVGRTPRPIVLAASPGAHVVAVRLFYRGRRGLEVYAFQIDSSHELHLERGRVAKAALVEYEGGDASTPLEERPAVRWLVR